MPETVVSQSAIYSARPTLRIAGQEDTRATGLVSAMRMEESEGGMSRLTLRFINQVSTSAEPELAFNGTSSLKLGAEIQVYAGDEDAPREIFCGKISALEIVCVYGQPPELVVLAEDALSAARHARRSKIYIDMSPADVVQAIAGDLGLNPGVSGLSTPVGTWAQLNETDLGFLRRLLARFDADLQVVGRNLQVAPRSEASRGSIELALYGQLARVRITADIAEQVTAVSIAGWNAQAGQAVQANVTDLLSSGPGSGTSGLAWAQTVFNTRPAHLTSPAVDSDAAAQAVAQAALDQRTRRFVRADGVAEGNANLRVGSVLRLSGIAPQFDNSYYTVEARHIFDLQQGYRTEFMAESAFLGA